MPAAIAIPAGLTSAEARKRLADLGPNVVVEKAPPPWQKFLAKLWAPVPWMLEAALVLQIGLGEYVEAAVIGALLLFNATLGFFQEGRAGAALAALKNRLTPTALVRRDGEWARLPASDLVPGDAVRLSLGAMVPADASVVSGSVMVDQSTLTGESVPVDANPGSRVYAGSIVRRGQAVAEVTATGSKAYFGRTAELVRIAHAGSTEQKAIFGVTRNLMLINGAVAVLIVTYGYAIALPSPDLIRLALTALLATIPVALSATFTLSAAFGGLAGALLTPLISTSSQAGMAMTLKGVAAAVLGGMASPAGAVAGGFLLGLIEALSSGYVSSTYQNGIASAILIVLLLVRPRGLFSVFSRQA
jgi:H+-transporting ATPase